MAITPRFRIIAFAACVVSFILLAIVGVYRTDAVPHKNVFYDVIYVISQLAYIIALYYLIRLLKYIGERKFIVAAFSIYMVLIFIASIMGFTTFPPNAMESLIKILNILMLASIVYLVIASFMVKNSVLSASFKVFAMVQILIVVLTFVVTLVLARLSPVLYFRVSRYTHFGGLIIIGAIADVVLRSHELLLKKKAR